MKKKEKATEKQFVMMNEDGSEELCNILFTYETTYNDIPKNYVIFEFANTKEVSAAIYEEDVLNPGQGELKDIETDEEWLFIEEIYEEYINSEEEEDI